MRIVILVTLLLLGFAGFSNGGRIIIFHYKVSGIMKMQDESTKIFINGVQIGGINQDEALQFSSSQSRSIKVGIDYFDARSQMFVPAVSGTDTYVGINVQYSGVGIVGTVGVRLTLLTPEVAKAFLQTKGFKIKKYDESHPVFSDTEKEISPSSPVPATAFLLCSSGIVATSYLAVEGAKKIVLYGINGNMKEFHEAQLLAKDEKADIALLKLKHNVAMGFAPYILNSKPADTGEDIFILGYPMSDVMGLELKLSTGVISSKSGYLNEAAVYQISAPVQMGNAGSPLFDKSGNLLGMVTATIPSAQNVNYAVKTSYLENLLYSIDGLHPLNTQNRLSGKPLTEQVKELNNYIYYMEVF